MTQQAALSPETIAELKRQKADCLLWFDELNTTTLKQGRQHLGDEEIGFCCMGIGARMFNICFSSGAGYSVVFQKHLGLLQASEMEIAVLNDTEKLSFPEIAKRLRANPEKYFEWGKYQNELD